MNSFDIRGRKGFVASLLYVCPIAFGTTADAATVTARAVSCTPPDHSFVRHIELRRHTGSSRRCDVLYTKPDEGGTASVVWHSAASDEFCKDRFEHFVNKHRNVFGWSCAASTPASPGGSSSIARTATLEPENSGVRANAEGGGATETSPIEDERAAATVVGVIADAPSSAADEGTASALRRVSSAPEADGTNERAAVADATAGSLPVDVVFPEEDHVSARVKEIALALERQRIGYNTERLSDCSGVFHRVLGALQGHFPTIELPTPRSHRSTRRLARWYDERGMLRLVRSAADEDAAIRPGVVLFFGQNKKRYENAPAEYLFDRATGIAHMGVVVEVTHDAEGRVSGYGMFHGRRTGTEAKITRYHRRSPSKASHPPYGNGAQQWVAYSPVLPPDAPSLATDEQIAENAE